MANTSKDIGSDVDDGFDDGYDETYEGWYDKTSRGRKKSGAGASKNVHRQAHQLPSGQVKQAAVVGSSRLTTGEAKVATSDKHPSGAHQQADERGKLEVAKAAQQDDGKAGESAGTDHTSQPEATEEKQEVALPKPVVDSWDMYS